MTLHEEERPDTVGDDFEIEPWYPSDLMRELHALRAMPNAQRRGYKLEALLQRAFQRAHFQAAHNPKMAEPRQTDFAVISHNHRYLCEAKWESRPTGTDDVDAIRSRLKRSGGTVVGLLFTMSGITDQAAEEIVRDRRDGLVLVFDESDIRLALSSPHELERHLRLKQDELVVHGRVHRGENAFEAARAARRSRTKIEQLPTSCYRLLSADGKELPWFHGAGGFSLGVFCLDLPDVDWVPAAGSGVCLDMPIATGDQRDVLRLLVSLSELGWTGNRSQWSIHQHGRNWHGCGADTFAEALRKWKERTRQLEDPHHSEEFVYFEVCDGGFYTVSGSVSAERTRAVVRCNVSFQLIGMPLDPGALQQLYRRLDVPSRGYFRPLVERSVTRQRFDDRVPLQVLGYVVEPAGQRWPLEDWVVGLLAVNPYQDTDLQPPDELARDLEGSGVIVCALRSHHPLSKPKERYELWSYERARSCLQMSRPHQERCEGDGCPVGLGGLVVAGRDAAPLLEAVEAPFHHVAPLVELLVEDRRAPAPAAKPEPVADLVGSLGDGVADAPASQPSPDGPGAVALVAQDVGGPHAGPSRTNAGHPDLLHHGGELGAVVGVPTRDREGERAAKGVAGQVDFAGQATSGASEAGAAEPPFRAPAACWWARTTVESSDTSQSMSPAASARAWAARSIRSKVPSSAQRRKRVCSVCHGPYRSGTSRQAVPVRNFHTIPLSTVRSSTRFRPRKDSGSSGRTNSHSASDSSWRRITQP